MGFLRSAPVVSLFIAIIFYFIHVALIRYLMQSGVSDTIIPLLEEFFKFLTLCVSGHCAIFWTGMFGIEEALAYIGRYKDKNGIFTISVIRMLALLYHFVLLGIQYYGWKLYRKTGKFKYVGWYFFHAVCFHYLWNLGLGSVVLQLCIEPILNLFSISLVGR